MGEFLIPQPNSGSHRLPVNIPAPTVPTAKKAFVIGATGLIRGQQRRIIASNISNQESPDKQIGTSILGTPVYGEIILKDTVDRVVPVQTTATSGQGWARFVTCLAIVNKPRNIVRTPIAGRNGTIKEYISDDDFHIEIRGEIVEPTPDVAPLDDIRNINNLLSIQNEIIVVSDFISSFGISSCVVEFAGFEQIRGFRNVITFSMNLLSDDPYEAQLGITNNANVIGPQPQ